MDHRLRYLRHASVMDPRIRIRIHVKRHGSGTLTQCKHMCSIKISPKNLSHPGGKPTALYQRTTRALETTLLESCSVLLVPGSGDQWLGHTTGQCCGSASPWCWSGCRSGFDLSPWCGSGCGSGFRFLFEADPHADTTFHPDVAPDPILASKLRLKPLKKC